VSSQDGDMSRRDRTLPSGLCFVLFLAVSVGAAETPDHGPAIANGPAALSSPGAGTNDGSSMPAGEGDDSLLLASPPLDASGPPTASTDEGAAPSPPAPGGPESKALGEPNALFSARPAEEPAEATSGHPLKAIDPRENELTRVIGALAAVLGLLMLLRLFLKRASGALAGGGRPSGVLEILARYPIARGQSLQLMKIGRRILLVHQSGTSMSTLTEVTDGEEVAALLARMEAGARSREALRFKSALRTFQDEHDRLAPPHSPAPHGRDIERAEIVDLTRGRSRGLGALLGRGRASA
jgi:flagellar biogenesis protein FliO